MHGMHMLSSCRDGEEEENGRRMKQPNGEKGSGRRTSSLSFFMFSFCLFLSFLIEARNPPQKEAHAHT
jgi:hypothetical protein